MILRGFNLTRTILAWLVSLKSTSQDGFLHALDALYLYCHITIHKQKYKLIFCINDKTKAKTLTKYMEKHDFPASTF